MSLMHMIYKSQCCLSISTSIQHSFNECCFFIVSSKLGDVQCTMSLIQIMLILYHFTSPYDESERSLYHLVDRNMNSAIRKVMEA